MFALELHHSNLARAVRCPILWYPCFSDQDQVLRLPASKKARQYNVLIYLQTDAADGKVDWATQAKGIGKDLKVSLLNFIVVRSYSFIVLSLIVIIRYPALIHHENIQHSWTTFDICQLHKLSRPIVAKGKTSISRQRKDGLIARIS